jgi:hypothetical protein
MIYWFIDCLTLQWLCGLNAKYWPARSGFKFLVTLKAFMNIQHTETDTEVLVTRLQLNKLCSYFGDECFFMD